MSENKIDYGTLSAQLDEVVAALQSPDISVDEAIKKYEVGMKLVAAIEKYLTAAEHKVSKLKAE